MINFQDYDISDNARYTDYLRLCIQMPSNLSPVALCHYNNRFGFKRGYAGNLCWHKFIDYDGVEKWTAPVGDWDEINWKKVFAENVPAGTIFDATPEYLIKIWQNQLGDSITVEEQRNYWDYILYLDRIEKLEGHSLKRFRNARKFFDNNYDYTVEEITPQIFDELKAFQVVAEENLQQRAKVLNIAEDDNAMFYYALEHWEEAKTLFGFVIRVDGKIVAYSIDEQIDETHAVGLFAKANYDFKGINQFNYWYDAKINIERGNLTVNIMDDVGEENLRFFKEHLAPLAMLKKFCVTYNPPEKISDVNITSQRAGNALTIKISGKLNTNSANSAKNEVLTLLDGVNDLTFDLNGLEYISSSGLRILIAALKKIKAQGGAVKIKNAGVQVREVLDMTGFAQVFEMAWRPNI